MAISNLVTAEEIAQRLEVKDASVISNWRKRHRKSDNPFPEPVKETPRAIIWDWPDVEAWAKATGRMDARGNPITPTTDPTRKRKATDK